MIPIDQTSTELVYVWNLACSGAMYSLVPATVCMIMLLVLSPKSATLMSGIGAPFLYFLVRRIFSGLRSLCVIR